MIFDEHEQDDAPRHRRWDDGRPWTRGEQRDHERSIGRDVERLEAKVDRLTWLVAAGTGIISAAAFFAARAAEAVP